MAPNQVEMLLNGVFLRKAIIALKKASKFDGCQMCISYVKAENDTVLLVILKYCSGFVMNFNTI